MAKDFSKQFYHSKSWIKCRAAFIAERINTDGGMCEHCKERLGYIVDHKEELTASNIDDPDISLNQNNFQYLCLDCHNKKTLKKNFAGDFDENGQPLPPVQ